MWDKWKKKIENFIWKEVEIEEVEDRQVYQQQELPDSVSDIKTRMVYQYPNNKTYRFPQFHEQGKQNKPKNDIDKPAYLRKAQRQTKIEARREERPVTKAKNQGEKKPFERTEVPSPIYGFRERSLKTEDTSVPAYLRKQVKTSKRIMDSQPPEQVKHAHTDYVEDNVKPESVQVTSSSSQPIPSRVERRQSRTAVEPTVQEQKHYENVTGNEVKQQPQSVLQQENRPADEGTSPVEQRKPVQTTAYQRREQTAVKRSGPYNVLMNATDRQKQLHKQTPQEIQGKPSNQLEEQVQSERVIQQNDGDRDTAIPLHLLNDQVKKSSLNDQWIAEQQELLEKTLKYFNVRARVVNATQGPAVTRFEVHPELGVKVSKVKNLSDDLKLNMSAKDIRIEAPIPGKNTIGIEVPNPTSQMVSLQEIVGSETFNTSSSPLTIALGLSIEGTPVVTNIQKMPHGLIAGATGSGKSVCINTILLSLIYKASHEDVKFLLIDPKMVELAPYNGIPHLVSPVITNVKAATAALKWAVNEMEDRYERFVQEGVRDIERYNQKIVKQNRTHEKMPFIVIVIDELADLMMVSPQDVEDAISRIAQKARACGIHLLLATQRPSVDVLTGLIKANIPTRIAFSVSSQIDSRTILDTGGAEKLLGKGDMLFIENGTGKSVRLQGPFVSDDEIERVTAHVRSLAEPNYLFEQESLLQQFVADEEEDDLLQEAVHFIFEQNSASTSLLQRHFKIGYNRAARLMDTLEHKGIISGQNGSKPREVLITQSQLEESFT